MAKVSHNLPRRKVRVLSLDFIALTGKGHNTLQSPALPKFIDLATISHISLRYIWNKSIPLPLEKRSTLLVNSVISQNHKTWCRPGQERNLWLHAYVRIWLAHSYIGEHYITWVLSCL
ncbi:hypothetical protein GDO81_016405 [Engystomops pustulosus]|uniref:Uncharacterized protein n=1 Tax=Engystomops pustulosus TaxID=76066 RepID=A0AAV7AW35_ENGPU|nr:hypothetical protein GDO81_016405 [Engystomops pustulosus]